MQNRCKRFIEVKNTLTIAVKNKITYAEAAKKIVIKETENQSNLIYDVKNNPTPIESIRQDNKIQKKTLHQVKTSTTDTQTDTAVELNTSTKHVELNELCELQVKYKELSEAIVNFVNYVINNLKSVNTNDDMVNSITTEPNNIIGIKMIHEKNI